MNAGAVGVCAQKTSEAEALAEAGIGDIYQQRGHRRRTASKARGRPRAAHPPGHRGGLGDRRRAPGARHRARRQPHRRVRRGRRGPGPLRRRPGAGGRTPRARSSPTPGSTSPGCRPTTAARSTLRSAAARGGRDPACHRRGVGRARPVNLARVACPLVTGAGSGSFVFRPRAAFMASCSPAPPSSSTATTPTTRPRPAPAFEHAVRRDAGDQPFGGAVVDAGPASRTPSTPGCRASGSATTCVRQRRRRARLCTRPRADPARCPRSARRSGWCRALRPDRQPARPLRCPARPGWTARSGRVARHRARLRRLTRRVGQARRRRRSPGRACRCAGVRPGWTRCGASRPSRCG